MLIKEHMESNFTNLSIYLGYRLACLYDSLFVIKSAMNKTELLSRHSITQNKCKWLFKMLTYFVVDICMYSRRIRETKQSAKRIHFLFMPYKCNSYCKRGQREIILNKCTRVVFNSISELTFDKGACTCNMFSDLLSS